MFGNTYSLRLVLEFLKENRISFTFNSANIGYMLYEHGCRVKLNDTYHMSVQTHPLVCGEYFAETALQNMTTKEVVSDGTHGYYDVKRFYNPKDLFDHILSCDPTKREYEEEPDESDDEQEEEIGRTVFD